MKLLTKELINKIPALYSQEDTKLGDKIAYAKLFAPWSNWTWYILEIDSDKNLCFGYIEGFENEYGYFNLSEIEEIRGPSSLKIERDKWFRPTKMQEIVRNDVCCLQ